MYVKHLRCVKCGGTYPAKEKPHTCLKHNKYYDYLIVEYNYDEIYEFPLKIKNSNLSLSRFLPLLPIKKLNFSLGEGDTPLIKVNLKENNEVYVKKEDQNPTGSFKDRESLICIQKALEFNIKNIFVISSGNAAISMSFYARKAGISSICFIPKNTPITKKRMIEIFGGNLNEIEGYYEDVYRKVIDSNGKYLGWNCTPCLNPYAQEGNKTISWEIWERIGIPDKIIVPCANGSLLASLWKGFKELEAIGKIEKLPQMIGVQIDGGDPIKKSLENGNEIKILENIPDSVADSVIASESYSSFKAMKALKESNGFLITVSEEEMLTALKKVIKKYSLLPEPSSAIVFAALNKINCINEKIVCIMSGSGLKYLNLIYEIKNNINNIITNRGKNANKSI